MTAYPKLFSEWQVRHTTVPNRVVFAPTCPTWVADPLEGIFTDQAVAYYEERARSGLGMIIIGGTIIHKEALYSELNFPGLWTDDQIEGLARVAEAVQRHGTRLVTQLLHPGLRAMNVINKDPAFDHDAEWWHVAPSQVPPGEYPNAPMPKEIEEHEIAEMIEAYGSAARRAFEAGLDGVEFHMAHGYLLASFLSPLTNLRTDRYGGSLENRLRFPLRVVRAVRALWPDEKPLSVRLSAVDWWPGGNVPDDAVEIARALKANGCDIVDVSSGQTVPYQRPRYGRQYQTPFADRIRHEAGIATMAVGNISSFEDVNGIIASGRADLCLMARAHLWDPYWTRHAAYTLGYPLPWQPQYDTLDRYTPRFGAAAAAFGPETGDE